MAAEKLRGHGGRCRRHLVLALAAFDGLGDQGIGLAKEGEAGVIQARIDEDLSQQE